MVERLAEVRIVEGRLRGIHADVGDGEARRGYDELLVQRLLGIEDTLKVEEANAGNVDLIILVHGHGLAAGKVHVDGVHIRARFTIVVVEPLEDDSLADPVLIEYERTSAHGVVDPPVPAAALDGLLVQDERCRVTELGEEVGFGRVDGDL